MPANNDAESRKSDVDDDEKPDNMNWMETISNDTFDKYNAKLGIHALNSNLV